MKFGQIGIINYGSDGTISATLGTLSDPIDAGATLNKTFTWGQIQSLPIQSTLKQFKVFCTVGGTLKLKIFQPIKGGSFNVTEIQTLTCAVGLNTFSVASSTLNETVIPANSLIGFFTPSSGGATVSLKSAEVPPLSAGYFNVSGDVSGNAVALTAIGYNGELQTQFTVDFIRTAPSSNYWIDEDFAGTALPAYGVNNSTSPWTFSAGKTTNAGTGLASFLDFYPTTNADRCTWAVEFEFKAAGDRFAVYRKPILGDGGAAEGTIGEVDLDNNQLVFYQTWTGGTTYILPSVRSTLTLTNLTLATGVRYRAELTKTSKVNTLKIIDTTNSDNQTLTVDNDPTNLSGLCYGRPGFAALTGTIDVKSVQFYPSVTNPNFIIYGDSITEGSGTDAETCYAQLTLDRASGNAWFSGDGGTLALAALRRLRHDLRLSTPRYVVVFVGANNSSSDAETTNFVTHISIIKSYVINAGAKLVVCKVTPNSDATRNARITNTINPAIDALADSDTFIVAFNEAISLNNDGSTYDPSMMADGIHPNTAGHAALDLKLFNTVPFIY